MMGEYSFAEIMSKSVSGKFFVLDIDEVTVKGSIGAGTGRDKDVPSHPMSPG
jgi:hypothetical protein